jgi:tyrosine-specific transport protein
LNVKTSSSRESLKICLFALVPPLVLSLLNPQIFFQALNFAGGICAVILFGILPAAMVWMGRYRRRTLAPYRVGGGKSFLILLIFISLFVLTLQMAQMTGLIHSYQGT